MVPAACWPREHQEGLSKKQMSFVHASAFTSLADVPGRADTSNLSQRPFSDERHPKVSNQLSSQTMHPYQLPGKMTPVSAVEQHSRLKPTYNTRVYSSAAPQRYSFLDTPGYPVSCASSSAVAGREVRKQADDWPTPKLPLAKLPYSTVAMFPCGSTKMAGRGDKISTLKSWLYQHRKNPYPTKGEKVMLAVITKMTLTQVSTWFANARRRLKKDSKITRPAINRSKDNDDDDVHITDDVNEIGDHQVTVTRVSNNVMSRTPLSNHMSTDKEAHKILPLKESIIRVNEVDIVDENRDCENYLDESILSNMYKKSHFVDDSTKDSEYSLPGEKSLVVSLSDSFMPDKLSPDEEIHREQFPLKTEERGSGSDLTFPVYNRPSSGTVDLSREKETTIEGSTQLSSSSCGRSKIWSVTDVINTSLPSASLTTTSSLTTSSIPPATTSSWYSSSSPVSTWPSNSLSPLMTTAAILPSAPLKPSPSHQHLSLSHEGIIHWPPLASFPFARLTNSFHPRLIPYPHTTGRLLPVNGQEPPAGVEDRSWQTLYLHSLYPGFSSRVLFSTQ